VYIYLKKKKREGKQPLCAMGGNSPVLAESLQSEFSSRIRHGLCAHSFCYVCINNCSLLKTRNGWLWLFALAMQAKIFCDDHWEQFCSFLALLLLLPFMSTEL